MQGKKNMQEEAFNKKPKIPFLFVEVFIVTIKPNTISMSHSEVGYGS